MTLKVFYYPAEYGSKKTGSWEIAEELEGQLAAYISQLPDQARTVLLLRREGRLINQQMADKLGISVKTVEAHMSKAMNLLKGRLGFTILMCISFGISATLKKVNEFIN